MSYRRRSYSRRGYNQQIYISPAGYLIIFLSAIPGVGALINMALLIFRKRYAWIIFPLIFFAACYIYWQQPNVSLERDILTGEIETEIEEALATIRIPKGASLEEETIISYVEEVLGPIVDTEFIKAVSPLAYHYYTNIGKKYQTVIEKGIKDNIYLISADKTYSISLYDLHSISDIHSFSYRYAEELIPYNWYYMASLVIIWIGWFVFIFLNYFIFTNQILKKPEDDYPPAF